MKVVSIHIYLNNLSQIKIKNLIKNWHPKQENINQENINQENINLESINHINKI